MSIDENNRRDQAKESHGNNPDFLRVDDTDLWITPGFGVLYAPDGHVEDIFTDFFRGTDVATALAFGIVGDETFSTWNEVMIVTNRESRKFLSYERKRSSGSGSGGSIFPDNIHYENGLVRVVDDAQEFILFDLHSETLKATMDSDPNFIRLSEHLYSCTYLESTDDDTSAVTLLFIFDGDTLSRVLKPLGSYVRGKITQDLKIVGKSTSPYLEYAPEDPRTLPTLVVQNKFFRFAISQNLGGRIVDGSMECVLEPTPETLGVTFDPTGDVTNGFRIGGINDEATILGISHINGHAMDELDSKLQSQSSYPLISVPDAMLGQGETLISHMAYMNELVLSTGLSHQDLATPMKFIYEHFRQQYIQSEGDCSYQGVPLHVKFTHYNGSWYSPFEIPTLTTEDFKDAATEITVTNTRTGKSVRFCELSAETIWRYGIYYGISIRTGMTYEVQPIDIIETFELLGSSVPLLP